MKAFYKYVWRADLRTLLFTSGCYDSKRLLSEVGTSSEAAWRRI